MDIIFNIIIFLFAIFILVLVHEFGHFWTARRLGIKVERFSIGFGKPIWRHLGKDGVEYVISPILLGGYVRLNDESYNQKPVWRRILVMLAGVTGNVILAILLFWLMFTIGIKSPKPIIGQIIPNSIAYRAGLKPGSEIRNIDKYIVYNWQNVAIAIISRLGDKGYLVINSYNLDLSNWVVDKLNPDPILSLGIKPYHPFIPPIINKVEKNSPAEKIGLQPRDRILAINGKEIKDWLDFIKYVQKRPHKKLNLTIQRANKPIELSGITGSKLGRGWKKIGYLGVGSLPVKWPPDKIREQNYSVFNALPVALKQTHQLLNFNVVVLTKLITGKISIHVLGGPITIFSASETAFKQGLMAYIGFLALLSIMLAFINILPIPGLDGGNCLFLLIEAFIRRPISPIIQGFVLRLGMIVLAILIFIALGNDLLRIFT